MENFDGVCLICIIGTLLIVWWAMRVGRRAEKDMEAILKNRNNGNHKSP
jgi:hypothetical protein